MSLPPYARAQHGPAPCSQSIWETPGEHVFSLNVTEDTFMESIGFVRRTDENRTERRPSLDERLRTVAGVGPNEPIVTDDNGYRTSASPYRFDLMPGAALLRMAKIMADGAASHGENNWKNGSVESHLNKLLAHVFAHLAGDNSDDHLGHAAWRAMAALEIHLRDRDPRE